MFDDFKTAITNKFEIMKQYPLFRTEVERKLLWLTYLESFPKGSNPMYKERTEHDCQACKSFIHTAGSMIAVIDNEMISIWDVETDYPYDRVAKELSKLVKAATIRNVFLHDQASVGVDKNYQDSDGKVLTWDHFHITLPSNYVSSDRGSIYGDKKATRDVFSRALEEITLDSIETVTELIDQNSLYRGEENLFAVQSFLKQKQLFEKLDNTQQKDLFCWQQELPPSVTRIRNSAIGTLLIDLSEGKSLDKSVRSFESKVAPANYKRPKALVTKAMIKRAQKSVAELGYTSALSRRFAVMEDITVNNVLFANRNARQTMNADVFDEMISETKPVEKNLEKVEEVNVKTFIKSILPKAQSLELLLENKHAGNLVNLVAPTNQESKNLFKWDNNFSWAYTGDVTDSIKERVKKAGGSVTGDFRASLSWFNLDDLDLHLVEPNKRHICFQDPVSPRTRGQLDVDMNVHTSGPKSSRNAVENITYPKRNQMLEGDYRLFVNNYSHRELIDIGFEIEIEFDGQTYRFVYDREVREKQNIEVATFKYSHKNGIKFGKTLPREEASKTLWNLRTQAFQPVSVVMYSPNHWNERKTGNCHYFFMLQDCKREGSSRGFFNEYLSDDLREHRKVFEILGSKMRTAEEGDQLSGLGFSSTQRNSIYCKVTGSFTRTIKITF